MSETENLTSKILIFEEIEIVEQALKRFCAEYNLAGLKPTGSNPVKVLETSSAIGGVFIGNEVKINGKSGLAAVNEVQSIRPELPIFYRLSEIDDHQQEEGAIQEIVAGSFRLSSLDKLKPILDEKLYSTYYPIPLVRGIQELSVNAFNATIKNCTIRGGVAYMARDEFIYGELFSLIPLESEWCRGFMMLQSTEQEVMTMISHDKTALSGDGVTFRTVNELFNEITNLIWGSMRSKYFQTSDDPRIKHLQSQVPIVVDHRNKFISFGSTNPQLCLQYQIEDPAEGGFSFTVYQKLVFNLSWNPELFKDSSEQLEEMIKTGELELF